MSSYRIQRIKAFKDFCDSGKKLFGDLASADHSHPRLNDLFSLCICPGGRRGGLDDKQFEVFYGNRPIGGTTSIGQNFQTQTKVDIAHGASLQYMRTDDGRVLCILNPAKSENLRCQEEGIILEMVKDPAALSSKAQHHWKSFIAYMESTCIDGNPTILHRLRTYWLRNFHSLIFKDSTNPPRAKQFGATLLKYILTVGLSGFLILVITWAREGIRDSGKEREGVRLLEELETLQKLNSNLNAEATAIRRAIEANFGNAASSNQHLEAIEEVLKGLKIELQRTREHLDKTVKQKDGGAGQPATRSEAK